MCQITKFTTYKIYHKILSSITEQNFRYIMKLYPEYVLMKDNVVIIIETSITNFRYKFCLTNKGGEFVPFGMSKCSKLIIFLLFLLVYYFIFLII